MTMQNRITTSLTFAAMMMVSLGLSATSANAAFITVASFDVNLGASPTQAGFESLTSTGTGTQNGITLTSSAGLDEFRNRLDDAPLLGHPSAALLQDFGFENDGSSKTVTFGLTGLEPDTLHQITIYSYDRTSNNGATSNWYENAVAGLPLVTHTNIIADPDSADFSLSLMSDAFGAINIVGDAPSILIFNGLTVAEPPPIPEPSSFLLLGLGALGLVRHSRRRRA